MTEPTTADVVEPAPSEPAGPRWTALLRREGATYLELLAVTGLAFAQPLFAVFGDAPDQFVYRGATGADIRLFALVVLLAAPTSAWIAEVVVGLVSTTARRALHLLVIWGCVAAFLVQVLRGPLDGWLLIGAAVVLGAGAAYGYDHIGPLRLWIRFLGIAPPVFAALFLLTSATGQLLTDTGARAEARPAHPAPVVMIIFDELALDSLMDSDGTIDAELYPNFARLAAGSHWFRNTTTVSNSTWQAVPAILSSKPLPETGTPTGQTYPDNLFTLLGQTMPLDVSESVTRLCPESLCKVKTRPSGGFPAIMKDAARVMRYRLRPHQPPYNPVTGIADAAHDEWEVGSPASFDPFLDGLATTGDMVHFVHIILPHQPFVQYPDGRNYTDPTEELSTTWPDQTLADLGRQRHLLQTASADRLLGMTLDALEAAGTYDESLITVVADHGITFDAGQDLRLLVDEVVPSERGITELAWVPFFLKEPGQTGPTVNDADVSVYDVLPTMADVLGVELKWEVAGRSAFDAPASSPSDDKGFYRTTNGTIFERGPEVSVTEEVGHRILRENAIDRFLPAVGDPQRWWKRGPHRDLVGTDVADHDELAPLSLELDPVSDADDVQPDGGLVPGIVLGSVPDADVGDQVAVAVNGTIRATTEVWDIGDGPQVAALVAYESFVEGANEIEVYVIP
ncbi:MAG: sulfatase-like hydrolase/transferase [Actinobacteria bacterium]|nr:sulfatase-like hydrolase/transferase [Actinomycetota bacterium]